MLGPMQMMVPTSTDAFEKRNGRHYDLALSLSPVRSDVQVAIETSAYPEILRRGSISGPPSARLCASAGDNQDYASKAHQTKSGRFGNNGVNSDGVYTHLKKQLVVHFGES